MIPNKEQALELLKKYNSDPFHIKHGLIVSGVMEHFAKELGYADESDFWGVVGLLHDLDFEQYPDQHCIKSQELMREEGLDESIIHATARRNTKAQTLRPAARARSSSAAQICSVGALTS